MCICAFKVLNFMNQPNGHASQQQNLKAEQQKIITPALENSYYDREGAGEMGKKLLAFSCQSENTGAIICFSKKNVMARQIIFVTITSWSIYNSVRIAFSFLSRNRCLFKTIIHFARWMEKSMQWCYQRFRTVTWIQLSGSTENGLCALPVGLNEPLHLDLQQLNV